MKKLQQSQHLQLIQGGKKPLKLLPEGQEDKLPLTDIKVSRISDWNRRMESLFARQKV